MVTEIYLDESGYTGEDLATLDQPVFVIASTNLPKHIAKEILAECFPRSRAGELKHSRQGSRASGQESIVRFIRELKRYQSGAATFIVHKRYALITYMVDWWVEPAMRKDGIDLYNRGGNIGLSHLIYCILNSLLPERVFDRYLARFQSMMRKRTRKSYNEFWDLVYETFHKEANGPLQDTLVFLLGGERKLGFENLVTLPEHVLDPALTCALPVIQHWHDIVHEPLVVVHDQSSAMAKGKWIWDLITSKDVPKVEVGYDRRKMRFPLNVERTEFGNSEHYLQLQIADLLAGATAAFAKSFVKSGTQSDYVQALGKVGIEEFKIGGLWPSTEVAPEQLDTIGENTGSLVDFVHELVRDKKLPK